MLLDRKPFLYLWRPIYRTTFQGLVWPFLTRVKQFFFAEISAEIRDIHIAGEAATARIASLEHQTDVIVNRLIAIEIEQQNEWHATQSLLLCLFSNSTEHHQSPAHIPGTRAQPQSVRAKSAT